MSLVVVAAEIPLTVSGIKAVAARDTDMTTSMGTPVRLTETVARHCNVAATTHGIAVVVRNTWTRTMGG